MTTDEFENKVVLVTGAASGLGRATALAFARQGAKLALADIDVSGLDATKAQVERLGRPAIPLVTDIADASACLALAPKAVEAFGNLDVVCNVAGAFGFAHAAAISPQAWDKIHDVNVRGPFFIIQAAMPFLIESAGAVNSCFSDD